MKYLLIIETKRGFNPVIKETPEEICEFLNTIGDLKSYSLTKINEE